VLTRYRIPFQKTRISWIYSISLCLSNCICCEENTLQPPYFFTASEIYILSLPARWTQKQAGYISSYFAEVILYPVFELWNTSLKLVVISESIIITLSLSDPLNYYLLEVQYTNSFFYAYLSHVGKNKIFGDYSFTVSKIRPRQCSVMLKS
jgi:hypothetical protein